MPAHTKRKPSPLIQDQEYQPQLRVERPDVVTYSSFDVEFIDYTTAASPMPTKAIANTLTALVVVAEALLFVWWFGLTGLWVFIASTVVYSLLDARTRRWLKGLLKNKSAGSGGSA